MAEIVIIGGGISGTAAAYELARQGARVTLLERGTLAAMASGWTLAGVRQSGRHPAELPLARAAVARWATLDQELGADVEYRRGGNLRLARTPEEIPVIERVVAEGRASGIEVDFLPDRAAVQAVAPALSGRVLAASLCPTDGHANPTKTVAAFAAAAERHGATIRTGVTVEGIEAIGGRVTGVRTSDGSIPADLVVVTAGVYSQRLLRPLGVALPLRIAQVAVIQTIPLPPLITQVLGVANADIAGRQEVGGAIRFTGGAQPWPHDLDALRDGNTLVQPALGEIAPLIARGEAILPALEHARINRIWGGLLDMTPDHLPVIERSREVDGLIVAAGFSGHGFCLGPVTGQIVRELALDGASALPIAPFTSARFAGHAEAAASSPTLHG